MTEDRRENSPWNSLEVAKLIASLLTPIVVALMGAGIQREIAHQDMVQKANTRLADRRIAVYDSIKNDLNRIYCFVEDIGTWKAETPDSIVELKRNLDQTMYTNQAIWSPETFQAYLDYMSSAFATFQGVGVDAKIKTTDVQKAVSIKGWRQDWSLRLAPYDAAHRKRYEALQRALSRDLMLLQQKN